VTGRHTPSLSRRGLLATTAASALALAGCAGPADEHVRSVTRSRYGDDPSQYGDLFLPAATPLATVVVLHGGAWTDGFGADSTRPMSRALQDAGYAVWNLEYRRLGASGGWPMTFADVAAGIDHLTTLGPVDTSDVRLIGHSAGGQLAVWAASRRDGTPGGPSAVTVTACVSLAGVLDLTAASRQRLGGASVDLLMGGPPEAVPDHYDQGDPTRLVPAGCPVVCVHPSDDQVVPREQATAYVAAAGAVEAPATFHEVPGDHASVIDPHSKSWSTIIGLLET
jgi:acetyl esterase/lipase